KQPFWSEPPASAQGPGPPPPPVGPPRPAAAPGARRPAMQQRDAVEEIARQQSPAGILARVVARSKGLPMPPMSARRAVLNESSGQGWTMWADCYTPQSGNPFWSVVVPTGVPVAMCIAICRFWK
ncbi:unnamed protein product, partial [Prorocentrum cordatum]